MSQIHEGLNLTQDENIDHYFMKCQMCKPGGGGGGGGGCVSQRVTHICYMKIAHKWPSGPTCNV